MFRALFRDRSDAGRQLAEKLKSYAYRSDVLLLALPRGGVVVAFEVSQMLGIPMDVFLVRKVGVPGHEELAMGAITANGTRVINYDVLESLGITQDEFDAAARREYSELERRKKIYRGDQPELEVAGKTVIVIDDGLATGASMRVAVVSLRKNHPLRIVVAVPTGATETCNELKELADEVICLYEPSPFYGVGMWYQDFSQISDDEVSGLLRAAQEGHKVG